MSNVTFSTNDTLTSLIQTHNALATKMNAQTRKYFANKAAAIQAIESLMAEAPKKITAPVSKETVKKAAKTGKVYTPNKYRFGPVWTESVKTGTGVAFMPTNFRKLEAHAKELGVDATGTAEEIAGRINEKLNAAE